jgi:hypothetical protein
MYTSYRHAQHDEIPYAEITDDSRFDRDVAYPAYAPARPKMKWYKILGKIFFVVGVILGVMVGVEVGGRGAIKVCGVLGGLAVGLIGLLIGLVVDALVMAASSSQA